MADWAVAGLLIQPAGQSQVIRVVYMVVLLAVLAELIVKHQPQMAVWMYYIFRLMCTGVMCKLC